MDFYKGESRILYIRDSDSWMPIACLTSNPFSETSEFIDTTTRDNKGWVTSKPVMQYYSIQFDGLQIISDGLASYTKLKRLKRDNTLIRWKISGSFPIIDYGLAYVSEISEGNLTGEFLTFTGSLVGFGKPIIVGDEIELNLILNDDNNAIFNSGDNIII